MKKSVFLLVAVIVLFAASLDAKTHTIKTGDTLWDLAATNYGDPTLYTVLLEVNGITNPRTILNGTVIVIPDKSTMKEIANETDKTKRKNLIKNASGNKGNSDVSEDTNPNTSNQPKDQVSRKRVKLNERDLSFEGVLGGPKTTADTLIKVNETK
ncbi:MAG: LysM peptidoglycan-binding domain-containing protein [Candidatus Riflebacteria bacterium]|nr:LysM peptidoglycan-binding domain-containing protein [Candidatus Riflebacteria bacterium]